MGYLWLDENSILLHMFYKSEFVYFQNGRKFLNIFIEIFGMWILQMNPILDSLIRAFYYIFTVELIYERIKFNEVKFYSYNACVN